MKVIKRDGRIVNFDRSKIVDAILKAYQEVDNEIKDQSVRDAGNIAEHIFKQIRNDEVSVEKIQDMVEKELMKGSRKDVAKSYVIYRNDRTRLRQRNSRLMKIIDEKIKGINIQNQNANVDEASFGGRRGEAISELMKQHALDNCMSEMAKNNHLNNEIYIHDLDAYSVGMHNCLSIPFDKLLGNGFNTRQTDVRPAQSASTAFQLVAVIFQLQSLQQFGGVSATHLDWTMVPYVRKSFYKHYRNGCKYIGNLAATEIDRVVAYAQDNSIPITDNYFKEDKDIYQYALDMTEKEVYQGAEGLLHNLNTLQSRSGNQLPFTSVNYGTCTLFEGRMVTKALLNATIKGVGKLHKTPVFPCGIFQYMKGINDKVGTPNYDLYRLALKSTSLRLYPNYANVDWSGNKGSKNLF